jgi:hypothetical protein
VIHEIVEVVTSYYVHFNSLQFQFITTVYGVGVCTFQKTAYIVIKNQHIEN